MFIQTLRRLLKVVDKGRLPSFCSYSEASSSRPLEVAGMTRASEVFKSADDTCFVCSS